MSIQFCTEFFCIRSGRIQLFHYKLTFYKNQLLNIMNNYVIVFSGTILVMLEKLVVPKPFIFFS